MSRFAKTIVVVLLVILLASAAAVVVASWQHWRQPDSVGRVHGTPASNSATDFGQLKQDKTDEKQVLIDELKDYSDRVSDLEKLISVLLGLSAIYTIALGLSSWASVQMNLQQAKEWMQSQQEAVKGLRERAEESVKKTEESKGELVTLLGEYKMKLAEIDAKIAESTDYARTIPNVMATLAVALQRNDYIPLAESATEDLRALRSKNPTDPKVNFFLGRAYKLLKHFRKAAEAMTFFIEAKERANQEVDDKVADAYYNRACYQSLLWERTTDVKDKQKLQNAIIADLWEGCRRDAKLLDAIPADLDFKPVLQLVWFKETLTAIRQAGF